MSGADADTSAALLAADGGTSTANSATGSSAAAAPPTGAKSEASSAGEKAGGGPRHLRPRQRAHEADLRPPRTDPRRAGGAAGLLPRLASHAQLARAARGRVSDPGAHVLLRRVLQAAVLQQQHPLGGHGQALRRLRAQLSAARAQGRPRRRLWVLLGGDNVEELVAEMGVPTMMLAAGNDLDNVKSGGLMHAALRDAGVGDADLHFQEFASMKHGWVNRGDLDDTATARDVETALNLVEGFMRKHLLGGGAGGGEGKGVGAGGGGSGGGAAAGD